jgi:glycosyltransferase involved in cell wall biosynthesis
MKKVVVYLNMFLLGGIEASLANILSSLVHEYEITLLICIHMYELEVMLPKLPPNIKIQYVLDGRFMSKNYYRRRKNTLTFLHKCAEVVVKPCRTFYIKRTLTRFFSNYDILVDYALALPKYKINFPGTKIGYFLYSIEEHYAKNPRNMKFIRQALPSYTKIIVLSTKMLDEVVAYFPKVKDKFTVMYSQIDFNNIYIQALQKIDLEVAGDFILSVARLEENQKDFTTLIHAYKIFHEQYQRPEKLVIIGSGVDAWRLQALVKELHLSQQIIFLGHKLNPYPWFKQCKLFILSSKFEGLPTVLIDAMILHKIIISSNCPTGPEELLMNGACGKLITVGDVDAFASAMAELVDNTVKEKEYIKNIQANLSRFNINANVPRLKQLFATEC